CSALAWLSPASLHAALPICGDFYPKAWTGSHVYPAVRKTTPGADEPPGAGVVTVGRPPTLLASQGSASPAPYSPIGSCTAPRQRSEEHTSALQSRENLVCRL